MIVRVIEYIIQCDGCNECCAYGSHATNRGGASDAKRECADNARYYGWKEARGGRWLCPKCQRAERAARPRLLVDEIAMGLHHD